MREIELVRTGKEAREGIWLLTLDDREVVLTDPDGREATSFNPAEGDQRFKLPSFWESVKHLGVVNGRGEVFWFQPEAPALRAIRTYLDDSLAARGPEAIGSLRTRGWLYLLGGIGLFAVGVIVLLVAEIVADRSQSGGKRRFLILPLILGLIVVYRGIKVLRQCSRAARRMEDER